MDFLSTSRRTALYPPVEPKTQGFLERGIHRLYWEVSGRDDGVPVLFLHGGPGAGTHPHHRRYFDPRHYRIILFDQRGAGRSEPAAEVEDNTTADLIGDMEALRVHLGVERWVLFGGSWGSALGLAYAEAHPDRVRAMILRGIFLGRALEVEWFLYGMATVFPEAWRRFSEFLPEGERADLLASYYRRLVDPDPAVHMPAARAWAAYEGACSTLRHDGAAAAAGEGGGSALSLARIEAHYFTNDMFLTETPILPALGRLKDVPAVIVQGRYDMVCPIRSADELVRAWPGGADALDYRIIPDAGHAASEPGTRTALMAATEKFKSLEGADSTVE